VWGASCRNSTLHFGKKSLAICLKDVVYGNLTSSLKKMHTWKSYPEANLSSGFQAFISGVLLDSRGLCKLSVATL